MTIIRMKRGNCMKQKKLITAALTAAFLGLTSMTALAGQWRYDDFGQWYQMDDGSYPAGCWLDLDGSWYYVGDDGYMVKNQWISDTYYVGSDGTMLVNAKTPDGTWVDENGVKTEQKGNVSTSTYDSWQYEENLYGSNWYDNADYLSEGDKAAYHYSEKYWKWNEYKAYGSRYMQSVLDQYARIEANPTPETAAREMAWVEIPVWRLRNGQKVPDTTRIQVLSSIAEEVKAIFTEIYNGPEQFPIESIGGYSWRSNGLNSYHSAGIAIDINPDQNPQVREDGTVLVGRKWEPGVNPYSIGRDSDVVKVFGKYGWGWGAGFKTKDYMHFEF